MLHGKPTHDSPSIEKSESVRLSARMLCDIQLVSARSVRPGREEDDMAIEVQRMAPLLQVFDMPTSIEFSSDVLGFALETATIPGSSKARCRGDLLNSSYRFLIALLSLLCSFGLIGVRGKIARSFETDYCSLA